MGTVTQYDDDTERRVLAVQVAAAVAVAVTVESENVEVQGLGFAMVARFESREQEMKSLCMG